MTARPRQNPALSQTGRLSELWQKETMNSLGPVGRYVEMKFGRLQLTLRWDWNIPTFIDLLSSDLHSLGVDPHARRLPTTPNTAVYRLDQFKEPIYLKLFLYNHWRHAVMSLFSPSKARRAWEGGLLLLEKGLRTPPLVALGEDRRYGFIRKSFFVMEEVQGVRLPVYLDRLDRKDPRIRQRVLEGVGKTLGMLHRCGILHGDLNITNLLVEDSGGELPHFYFLDNEGFRQNDPIRPDWVLGDLGSFYGKWIRSLPRPDQTHILEGYLSENQGMKQHRRLLEQGLIGC